MHDLNLNKQLWEQTDALGEVNRRRLEAARVYTLNLMSAPGAGKTTLLERTLERLGSRLCIGVIEGDIQGRADADRLARFSVPVHQINTHGACHLDPRQVATVLDSLDLAAIDLLVIENVGNLVCPAEFDLGESERVMLLSVTEGHDKPAKYPLMFRTANLLILNKTDLLAHTDFDLAEASRVARTLHEGVEVISLSCRTGEGLDRWIAWLEDRVTHARKHWEHTPHDHPHDHSHDHAHDRPYDHSHDHAHDHAHDRPHDHPPDPAEPHATGGNPGGGHSHPHSFGG